MYWKYFCYLVSMIRWTLASTGMFFQRTGPEVKATFSNLQIRFRNVQINPQVVGVDIWFCSENFSDMMGKYYSQFCTSKWWAVLLFYGPIYGPIPV